MNFKILNNKPLIVPSTQASKIDGVIKVSSFTINKLELELCIILLLELIIKQSSQLFSLAYIEAKTEIVAEVDLQLESGFIPFLIRVYNPISNPFSLKEKLFSPDSISATKLEELFKGKYLPPESLKKTTLILPPITLFSFI